MVGKPSSSRKSPFDDRRKAELVEMIGATLRTQLLLHGPNIPDLANPEGSKALGYVYGFVDAALRSVGQDMAKMDIGPPVTYQVLRAVFDEDADRYLQWLQTHIGASELMMAGVMSGGQQFVDWQSGKLEMPMGLARFVLESQDTPSAARSSPASQPPSAVDTAEVGERWAMPVRAVTGLLAPLASFWLLYVVYQHSGLWTAFFSFLGLSFTYRLGASPMLAIAASFLSFKYDMIGPWFPISTYVLAAMLLVADTRGKRAASTEV